MAVLVNKYRDEDLMEFSGKLVEPTKLEKITLKQAAMPFNKGKCKKSGKHCSSHYTCYKKSENLSESE